MSKAFAVLGLFDSADALMKAIPKVKARKLGRLETYTPYPIHGMDDALELRRSPLGGMVLVMGVIGALTALGFQYWISAIDYPIVTGGKPPWSWEAFIPIMFEVTVLFATFTAGLGMLLLMHDRARQARKWLVLSNAAGSVKALFAMTDMSRRVLTVPVGGRLEDLWHRH